MPAVAALLATSWLIYLAVKVTGKDYAHFSAITVILLVIVNKIYSTQYVVSILPILLIRLIQLPPRVDLFHITSIAIAIQILNCLKTPALADIPYWIIASALFWTGLVVSFVYLTWITGNIKQSTSMSAVN